MMPFDTTADTTGNAIRCNSEQGREKNAAYLSRLCNEWQRLATDVGGLWLRRSRVRALSLTLPFAGKIRGERTSVESDAP
jgi:hypothetical protein